MTLDNLVTQLRAAFGPELRAVVLYGSAVTGDHNPKMSDYNVLVLVESLAADRLRGASAAATAWADAGNPPPLMLTVEEWSGSSDIFPMEYADILEHHRVLHGELPSDVRVDAKHLRLELEHEAMGTLLQLRRSALASGGDGKLERELLQASLSTVLSIFRALLRLHSEQPPADNLKLSMRAAEVAGFEAAPFAHVVQHKRGERSLRGSDASAVLAGYLEGMQSLVRYLDTHSPEA